MGEPLEPLFEEEKDLSEAKVRRNQRGGKEGGISFGPDTHSSFFFFFSPFDTWKL